MFQFHNPQNIYQTVGLYAHGVEVKTPQRFLCISGTVGLDKEGNAGKDFETQCNLVWNNIKAILQAAKMDVNNLVKVTCYLADRAYGEKNAEVRRQQLDGHKPALTVIVTELLEEDWLIEIDAIALAE